MLKIEKIKLSNKKYGNKKNFENKTFNKKIIKFSLIQTFSKLNPLIQIKNPVMFVVYLSSIFTTILWILALVGIGKQPWYIFSISLILWFTVLFGNFAESLAEGRGKAQADSLKNTKKNIEARKLEKVDFNSKFTLVKSEDLNIGDIVLVKAGEQIPMDGEAIVGVASVDESAITGESAPVIRESGGDRSAVTGGTIVISDWLIIKITSKAGESFLDKMISMVEGASRKKTPNEIALQIFLTTLTIIFLVVSICLYPFTHSLSNSLNQGEGTSLTDIVALTICLAPTTVGALLSSIGIAGMTRLNKVNVLATNGKAIEAAGDVDILLLDKTGTITFGNRQAAEFIPVGKTKKEDLAFAAYVSSLSDETAEGRSILVLAENKYKVKKDKNILKKIKFIEFSAKTRMSGVNILNKDEIRKGASDAIKKYVISKKGNYPIECDKKVNEIAKTGGTPLVVARNNQVLGIIHLKDTVKEGVRDNFEEMRKIGIKTIMITGDNPITAASIAAEAGVDDFEAEATPETKLEIIKKFQKEGHLVAMTGDGTNDAPALSQADVAVAMNSGTQAAKEAGNMVDLDSSPTKLISIVKIGKQLLMTRGALTTFSIANDIAKYFAIIPILFASIFPGLEILNFLNLTSANTALLSAIIYNALIIVALIPLSLKGVKYREMSPGKLLAFNLGIYGLGGVITPFICIKLIDLILTACGVR
ncbi:potassium-transporting ATPase subunit KdpB [Malacoplasma muris]|uniref:potassium-transporting ATPase subunit KdpB n=1 Tax=Malacoplasma muris TaxID=2119 RepID=UPI00398E71C4